MSISIEYKHNSANNIGGKKASIKGIVIDFLVIIKIIFAASINSASQINATSPVRATFTQEFFIERSIPNIIIYNAVIVIKSKLKYS
jgi:hypothetical protein